MNVAVSILVPVYNVEVYLQNCIESVLAQTYSDFELLLCDDGSPDHSCEICDNYANMDPRVKVIHQENQGQFCARRNLLAQAKGEYILFLDSDDWIAPTLVEETLTIARKNQVDLVLFGYYRTDDHGEVINHSSDLYPDGSIFNGESKKQILKKFATSPDLNHLWDKLIHRELLLKEDCKGLDHYGTGEDKLQLMPVFSNAKTIYYLAKPLYYYRLSVNGTGRNCRTSFLKDICQINEEMLIFLKKHSLVNDRNFMKEFYQYFAGVLALYIYSIVQNMNYSTEEIEEVLRESERSSIIQATMQRVRRIQDRKILQTTYTLYRSNHYKMLIWLIRLEQKLKNIVKLRFGRRN